MRYGWLLCQQNSETCQRRVSHVVVVPWQLALCKVEEKWQRMLQCVDHVDLRVLRRFYCSWCDFPCAMQDIKNSRARLVCCMHVKCVWDLRDREALCHLPLLATIFHKMPRRQVYTPVRYDRGSLWSELSSRSDSSFWSLAQPPIDRWPRHHGLVSGGQSVPRLSLLGRGAYMRRPNGNHSLLSPRSRPLARKRSDNRARSRRRPARMRSSLLFSRRVYHISSRQRCEALHAQPRERSLPRSNLLRVHRTTTNVRQRCEYETIPTVESILMNVSKENSSKWQGHSGQKVGIGTGVRVGEGRKR